MKRTFFGALGAAGLALGLAVGALPSTASDHLDAPLVQEDGRTDINDLYVFESPQNPENTVLVMTVNPVAGISSPETFDKNGQYRFFVDNDGDAIADKTIRIDFGFVRPTGRQPVKVRGLGGRVKGPTGATHELLYGGMVYAGLFDDPFFFDFQAFQDQVKGAGGSRTFCDGDETDFFAGLNVSGIVIEVPTVQLTNGDDPNFAVWATTTAPGGRRDRAGRPAIATALINDGNEDSYNFIRPSQDVAQFGAEVKANLLALSGLDGSPYSDAEAQGITDVLLPDTLTIDSSAPSAYLNGRGLADDVMDASLNVVTGGFFGGSAVLDSDCVGANDVAFPGTWPYLAPAHTA